MKQMPQRRKWNECRAARGGGQPGGRIMAAHGLWVTHYGWRTRVVPLGTALYRLVPPCTAWRAARTKNATWIGGEDEEENTWGKGG